MLNAIVALLIVQAVAGKAQVSAPPPAPEVVGKAAPAAPAIAVCIQMPEPSVNVRAQAWYINGETMRVGGRDWVKYGLPRVLAPGEVEFRFASSGGLFYAERGVAEFEILYLLVDPSGCEFQPYQLDG